MPETTNRSIAVVKSTAPYRFELEFNIRVEIEVGFLRKSIIIFLLQQLKSNQIKSNQLNSIQFNYLCESVFKRLLLARGALDVHIQLCELLAEQRQVGVEVRHLLMLRANR